MKEVKKQIVIVRPKTTEVIGFNYQGFQDIENLIKFTGHKPIINPDLSLQIKKTVIKAPCIVLRAGNGEIFHVIEDVTKTYYELVIETDFTPSDARTPIVEVKTAIEEKKEVSKPVKK